MAGASTSPRAGRIIRRCAAVAFILWFLAGLSTEIALSVGVRPRNLHFMATDPLFFFHGWQVFTEMSGQYRKTSISVRRGGALLKEYDFIEMGFDPPFAWPFNLGRESRWRFTMSTAPALHAPTARFLARHLAPGSDVEVQFKTCAVDLKEGERLLVDPATRPVECAEGPVIEVKGDR